MSNQFNWRSEEDDSIETALNSHSRTSTDPYRFWIVVALIGLAAWTGWRIVQNRLGQTQANYRQAIQAILELEHQAFLTGDGELFFSTQAGDPAWRAAQLLLYNQSVHRAGLQVTRVEQFGDFLVANVSWTAAAEMSHKTSTWQRVVFFQQEQGRFVHVPTAPDYWGTRRRSGQPWGLLAYYEADEKWVDPIAAFVADLITEICSTACIAQHQPFTLVLTSDYSQTAVPDHLHVPSPRLLALDESGEPAPIFWQQLRQQIEAHLTQATIRFAVPPLAAQLVDYEQAAVDFMAAHPDIHIEIVTLEAMPDDVEIVAAFDGAAITPTEAMLATGLVRDLTELVNSDPTFDQGDFYEQIWQGAWWKERIWFIPQAAAMNLLFYEKEAYRTAGLSEPSLRWTWQEMEKDLLTLEDALLSRQGSMWHYLFLDASQDTLFSYAYNWNNECQQTATIRCRLSLSPSNIVPTLEWYKHLVLQPGLTPDLASLSEVDRENAQLRLRAIIRVEAPVNYEHRLLISSIGVVPFPGSGRFDGITPLHVQGNMISATSQRPLAVWQWLKFLTYRSPAPRLRLVPARPSVAVENQYWEILPRPLSDAMRSAFPFARPVTIEEQGYFSWKQLSAVISGELSVTEAAHEQPSVIWFYGEN